jgi:hypothetical protein
VFKPSRLQLQVCLSEVDGKPQLTAGVMDMHNICLLPCHQIEQPGQGPRHILQADRKTHHSALLNKTFGHGSIQDQAIHVAAADDQHNPAPL